jgi:hypothetical protein
MHWFTNWVSPDFHFNSHYISISIFDALIAPYRSDDLLFSANEILRILESLSDQGLLSACGVLPHVLSATTAEHNMWSLDISRNFIYRQLRSNVSGESMRLLMRWMNVGKTMTLSNESN